jgi:thiol-disulfide isomerase/thioredoxin
MAEMQTLQMQIAPALSQPDALISAETRAENRDTVVPALSRMVELLDEAAEAAPVPAIAEQIKQQRPQMQALLVAFDDKAATQELEAAEDDGSKAALLLGKILKAQETQERVDLVKQIGEAAKQSENDAPYGQVAFAAMSLFDDEEITAAAQSVIENDLEGEAAEMMKAQIAQVKEAEKEMQAFKDKFIGKPLAIEGQTLDGSQFTSDQYDGKVVLVDFWATWCGPCIAELPALKEAYAEYHDQGFEIIGVSSDNAAEPLQTFLQDNPEMSWVQLFDKEQPGWHPIATELGITGIPTVFLIDRSGVVRDVVVGSGTQAEEMRKMIPELLEEEAGQPAEQGQDMPAEEDQGDPIDDAAEGNQ